MTKARMMRILSAVIVLAMLLGNSIGLPVNANGTVTVSVNAPATVPPGVAFTAGIAIDSIANFDATNYDVSFDPTILRLDDVTAGNISGTAIPVAIWTQTIPGTVTVVQDGLGLVGVNGTGYLAVLHFAAVGLSNQTSNITLSNGILSDKFAQPIPANWVGSSVLISIPPPNPIIPFVSDRDGNPEIYSMNATGGNQTALTSNPAYDNMPALSPDGSKMAFVSNRNGNRDIYVMSANGSSITQLTVSSNGTSIWPAWSPDGARIAFSSNRDGNFEIYTMNATDGSGLAQLTSGNATFDMMPAWSPDGSRIAFSSSRDGGYGEIYVMNANGSGITRLTNNPALDVFPAWSPDSARIAFSSTRSGNHEIYVMNADSSNLTQLTNTPAKVTIAGFAFSPGTVTVPVGTTVIWTNNDSTTHTVTSDATLFNSGNLGTGATFSFTFAQAGTFPYHCNIHPSMTGTIIVTPAVMDWQPVWSPNGTRIGFSTNVTGNLEVYSMDAATGSNQVDLSNNPANDWLRGKWNSPLVTTGNVSGVTNGSALLSGNLTSLGSAGRVKVSFQWGLTSNYTSIFPMPSVNATGPFSATLIGLSANTTYHFRAKAEADGLSFGADNIFTTPAAPPPPLTSIAVGPVNSTIFAGLIRQFNAAGIYADNSTANLTGTVNWTSSNPSVATIGLHTGLAAAVATGNTTIAATWGNVTGNTTLAVVTVTTVAVNNGNTINLSPGQFVQASSTAGIPVIFKNVATNATGLAAYDLTFAWDANVIKIGKFVLDESAGAGPGGTGGRGWNVTTGIVDNVTGSFQIVGTTTGGDTGYLKTDFTLGYLSLTASGATGNSTILGVTINSLVDNALQQIVPRSPINSNVVIGGNLLAETGVTQGLSSNVTGVVVVRTNINRVKNATDNTTANITGGIGSYSATVSSNASSVIQFLAIYGVPPFNGPSFNAGTGVFGVASVTSPIQPNNSRIAEVVPKLTGNTTTKVALTISYQGIGAAGQPGNVPEEHSNTITLLRGDADNNGKVEVTDSLAIKQYLVGQLTLSQINPINGSSPAHDGANGDIISVTDALAIEQMLVHQLNAYYLLP